MDEMTATRCRHTNAWLSIGGPESADAVHNRRRAFRRLLSSHSTLRNPTIFLAGFPPPLSLSLFLSLSLTSATIIGGNFFPAVPPSIPLLSRLLPSPLLSGSGRGWLQRRRMARRISRERGGPRRRKTNARGDVSFPDRRSTVRRKEIIFRNECPNAATRARWFSTTGDRRAAS